MAKKAKKKVAKKSSKKVAKKVAKKQVKKVAKKVAKKTTTKVAKKTSNVRKTHITGLEPLCLRINGEDTDDSIHENMTLYLLHKDIITTTLVRLAALAEAYGKIPSVHSELNDTYNKMFTQAHLDIYKDFTLDNIKDMIFSNACETYNPEIDYDDIMIEIPDNGTAPIIYVEKLTVD